MEWIEQMKEAMRAVSDACYANKDFFGCKKCPFKDYCKVIIHVGYDIPEAWDTVHFEVNQHD